METSKPEVSAIEQPEQVEVVGSRGIHMIGGSMTTTPQYQAYRAKLDEIHAMALQLQRKRGQS